MTHWRGAAFLVLALASVVPALAGEGDPMAQLDEALKAVPAFDYSRDSGPLRTVESIVMSVAKDPQRRAAVEERLLRTLAAAKTRDARDFLCRQLRTIGTARSVPALEAMLGDPQLSHMACFALGRIEAPEAADALRRALGKTTGKLQAGILNALAGRLDAKAEPAFVKLLRASDTTVAEAAATALGRVGGAAEVRALEAARGRAPKPLRMAIDNALLACAARLLAAGQEAEAGRIYDIFYLPGEPRHVRIGALHGLVAAREGEAAPLLVAAIKGADAQVMAAAISFVRAAKGRDATKTFADLLPSLAPEAQELLLRALGARGDAAAAPAIVAATRSQHEAVRIAALEALGGVGDASCVGVLLQAAVTASGAAQQAARASLVRLRGRQVDELLVKAIGSGDPKERLERIRALAGRRTAEAVGELLKAARDDERTVRHAAIRALGTLAREADLAALVGLAVGPKDANDRSAIEKAIATAFRRIDEPRNQAAPVLAALANAPADAKPTLLWLLGRAATQEALDAARAAVKDPDAAVSDAAVRTLSEWADPAPIEDLLALARTAPSAIHKVLALRGYVRLAGMMDDPTALYARAMTLAERPDEKKLVLAGLGTANTVEALDLVEKLLADERLRNEAGVAAIQIAGRLRERDPKRAKAALAKVLVAVKAPSVRQKAQDVVNDMEQYDAHIREWLGAGPYKVKDKHARELFDIAFPPEQPDAKDVKWTRLTRGVGAWGVNLESAFGSGDNCVAYVRTRVWSPAEQDVQLEFGSDDAIKVWLNGKVIHGRNADRSMRPRQDLVKARLREGWNDLMLKVVEHTGGWGCCCRIRKPDGSALDGLKYEAKIE